MELKAKTREIIGKKVRKLRREGLLPAIIYGHGVESRPIVLDYSIFDKFYRKEKGSSLVDLVVDEQKPVKVLIQAVERDPLTDNFSHIDFRQVKETEKITHEISLNFVGNSRVVKEEGGILVKALSNIEVKCLPGDLIPSLDVDISSLNTFDDKIYVRDLKIPPVLEVLEKNDEVVAAVAKPRTEEEIKATEETAAAEGAAPPIEEEGKKEGEEKGGEEKKGEAAKDKKEAPKDEKKK